MSHHERSEVFISGRLSAAHALRSSPVEGSAVPPGSDTPTALSIEMRPRRATSLPRESVIFFLLDALFALESGRATATRPSQRRRGQGQTQPWEVSLSEQRRLHPCGRVCVSPRVLSAGVERQAASSRQSWRCRREHGAGVCAEPAQGLRPRAPVSGAAASGPVPPQDDGLEEPV